MAPPIYQQLQDHTSRAPRTFPAQCEDQWPAQALADGHELFLVHRDVFEPLRARFCATAKQLRFEQLRLDDQPPSRLSGAEYMWSTWLRPISEWAGRFCFNNSRYNDWDVGMSTEYEQFGEVGLTRFVLSNVPHDAGARACKEWFGDYMGDDGPSLRFDRARQKECMCIVMFVQETSVDWASFPTLGHTVHVTNTTGPPFSLLRSLESKCEAVACPYGIITDGVNVLLMSFGDPRGFGRRIMPLEHCCGIHIFSTTQYSLPLCIAAILHRFSWSLLPYPQLCSGALPKASLLCGYNEPPQNFRDFDFYQLERSRDLFAKFLDWKSRASVHQPLSAGSSLVVEPNIIGRKLFAWRTPPKYHKTPVDAFTEAAIRARSRPRDHEVDRFLSSSDRLSFEVSEVKQCGNELYSQVFFGHITCGTRKSPRQLCLKLYDERFFPVPTLSDHESGMDPYEKLASFNFADQMLRREEAVYERIAERQGTILPHCYGFHEFILPDGVRVLGALLEFVSGESLVELGKDQWSVWSRAEKVHLFVRIRHAIRLLNHAGITQTDWHENQILFIRRPGFDAVGANRAAELDLVLIDFACAKQHDGRHVRTVEMEDLANAKFMLMGYVGSDDEAEEETGWDERDDCEE